VRHLGFVDDLAAAIGRYDAVIAPLRYGGGTKLKVLDAMARGAPVITTRVGAEGLGLTDGVNVLLAETPEEFAECVRRLRADRDWGERIATNARDHVARTLTWPAIQSRLAAWLRNAQSHRRAPALAFVELAQRFITAR
jgi:glycosyltransferase involved in cell wall biosynthesis